MNEKVNTFSLSGDEFMPKMDLRQPGFTYSASGPFTKNQERIDLKKTGDLRYISQKEKDRNFFQNSLAYGDFKDLNRRAFADEILVSRISILLKIQTIMDINADLF